MNFYIQILSLLGAGMILVAFFLLQRGRWSSHHGLYLWANFLGAALLTAVAVWDRRAGFIVLEASWAVLSLWSLLGRGSRVQRGST